jgi:hypothetical protein
MWGKIRKISIEELKKYKGFEGLTDEQAEPLLNFYLHASI